MTNELMLTDQMEEMMMVGLSGVPMEDIRPAQILLVQKSSETGEMKDIAGQEPRPGEFFHTGKMEIMKEFNCYFVWSHKSKIHDKNKDIDVDAYRAVGIVESDMSIFSMVFKSSALYCMSSLFTAVITQKKPMFVFKVKMEVKQLSNDKGTWHVPVLRLNGVETDPEKINILYMAAKRFDKEGVVVEDVEENVVSEIFRSKETEEIVSDSINGEVEDVKPEEIPF